MNMIIQELLIFITLMGSIYSAARFYQCFLTVFIFKEECRRNFRAEGKECESKKRKMYKWLVYTAALMLILVHLVLF